MGQKVHPNGLRVGFYIKWNTTWFAEKNQYKSIFFAQHQLERFLKAFFHLYSYTKNSAAKKVALVDLKWFRSGNAHLYFFVFFYKFRTRKRRWGILRFKKKKYKWHNKRINARFVFLKLKNKIKQRNIRFHRIKKVLGISKK